MLKPFIADTTDRPEVPRKPIRPTAVTASAAELPTPASERPIGELLRSERGLSEAQLARVAAHQRETGLRFGEAAVALDLVSHDDVLWALSQQFDYPYAADGPCARHPELVVASDPFSPRAEVFRDLCSQVLMLAEDGERTRRVLGVLSPDCGDGKTYLAANLAAALSQVGRRTLLIDADMRAPRQHAIFGLDSATGLSHALVGRAALSASSAVHAVPGLPSLFVMPAGALPPNPIELLQRPAFAQLIQELLGKFDHVVVDTPAMARGADARVIAARCGTTLAVGRKGTTRLADLHQLIGALSTGRSRLAGVVMNEHH